MERLNLSKEQLQLLIILGIVNGVTYADKDLNGGKVGEFNNIELFYEKTT